VTGAVRELRLALVCYGGVSLAIYMHGVTRELHKLLLASAAAGRVLNPFAEATSEHVYWNLLRRIEATTGVRLRVIVDVIAGTSAGGINGICLAKAIALNEPPDALRDLWFDKGDIDKLAAGAAWVPAWLKTPVLVVRSLLGAGIDAPLRGDEMCRWIHQAFEDMDAAPRREGAPASLLPPDHTLELYVTVTDLRGYVRELPIADPRIIRDLTHRHVLVFRHTGRGESGFGRAHNHALAFAARATSSFPGAFPPVTFRDYCACFTPEASLADLAAGQFQVYRINEADPARSAFIDGGVLDNAPFEHVLRAIRQRPATTEVTRRLLFIEPDPVAGEPSRPAPAGERPPAWVKTMLASLSSVPANQPILDDLNALAQRNRLVRRIRDVIEINFAAVAADVARLAAEFGLDLADVSARASPDRLRAVREAIAAGARGRDRLAYPSYVRLRLGFVLDGYAAEVARSLGYPGDSYPARFVESVVRDWATVTGLAANTPENVAAQARFLDGVDLAYHDRRLRFVIAAFNWWYDKLEPGATPGRAGLDRAKATVYRHLLALGDVIADLAATVEGRAALRQAFPDAEVRAAARQERVRAYVDAHRQALDRLREGVAIAVTQHVAGLELALHRDLADLTAGWPRRMRADLFARHLGFPFWDVIVYPIQALSGVDERDHVEVVRVSPVDARHLGGGVAKLRGIGLHHFAAFFERAYRENDYLWGRLDAAERLVGLLLDDPRTPGLDPRAEECRPVFEAILAEEGRSLRAIDPLVTDLRERVAGLPARR
jgi:patatin-related protein